MGGLDYGLLLALLGGAASLLAWYRAYARAIYAREREIHHIRNSISELSTAIATELSDLEGQIETLTSAINTQSNLIQRLEMTCSFSQSHKQGGQNG